jgi:predicted RNase H-like HicB family nuclease
LSVTEINKVTVAASREMRSMAITYKLTCTPDDNGTWLVTAPEFEEVVTFGETLEEAARNGINAIEEAIAARKGIDISDTLEDWILVDGPAW